MRKLERQRVRPITGVATAVLVSPVHFLLCAIFEMVAFWADAVWTLSVMLMFVTRIAGGALLPLALFPEAARAALSWTPFPYIVSFPIMTALGRVGPAEWLRGLGICALWVVILSLIARAVWRRGVGSYTAVGM